MSYKEKDIKFEVGDYAVVDFKKDYSVLYSGITHATVDSAYENNEDGLSIAIARAKYLYNRNS